ncbi:Hypothetical protein PFR_JS7-2_664 [Propionibacterium freudenreichii]|nr:Hypothetical protein PFR_JS7-1_664 [Propionibacterium freudenreichii]SCQ50205.1 Hypothetical protein PFR_JS7-2_664 [Propionibacterium freudenreichii]
MTRFFLSPWLDSRLNRDTGGRMRVISVPAVRSCPSRNASSTNDCVLGLPWFFGHLMWRGLVALGEGVVMSTGNEKTRRQRRKFTAQYRHEAARMVIDSGRTIAEVAQELGLGPQLLGRWVKAEKETMTPSTLSPDEREELKRLRKENADLRMDNEFLGKAAAFFAAKHQ